MRPELYLKFRQSMHTQSQPTHPPYRQALSWLGKDIEKGSSLKIHENRSQFPSSFLNPWPLSIIYMGGVKILFYVHWCFACMCEGTGVTDSCELPCRCWELNPGLLATAASAFFFFLKIFKKIYLFIYSRSTQYSTCMYACIRKEHQILLQMCVSHHGVAGD